MFYTNRILPIIVTGALLVSCNTASPTLKEEKQNTSISPIVQTVKSAAGAIEGTYKNTILGIEFNYPKNWEVGDLTFTANDNLLSLGMGPQGTGDYAVWFSVKEGSDINTKIQEHMASYAYARIDHEEKVAVNGIEGKIIYLDIGDMNQSDITRWLFLTQNSKIYIFGITSDRYPLNQEFDQLVASFTIRR